MSVLCSSRDVPAYASQAAGLFGGVGVTAAASDPSRTSGVYVVSGSGVYLVSAAGTITPKGSLVTADTHQSASLASMVFPTRSTQCGFSGTVRKHDSFDFELQNV